MAIYSTNSHSLSFTSNYKTLQVCDSAGSVVQTYGLDITAASVSVTVSGTNFVVAVAEDFIDPHHVCDVGAGDELSFSTTKMDGIGIVDLRDVNRTAPFDVQYDLACTVFQLKYVSGPFALKIDFPAAATNCFTEV